jgi:hypothetical protein
MIPSETKPPVMTLAEKMKRWPMLAAHRFEELETELLLMEERLTALEPKKMEAKPSFAQSETFTGKSIFAPAISKPVMSSAPLTGGSPPPTIFAPAKA